MPKLKLGEASARGDTHGSDLASRRTDDQIWSQLRFQPVVSTNIGKKNGRFIIRRCVLLTCLSLKRDCQCGMIIYLFRRRFGRLMFNSCADGSGQRDW